MRWLPLSLILLLLLAACGVKSAPSVPGGIWGPSPSEAEEEAAPRSPEGPP